MSFLSRLFPKREVPPASARTMGRNEACWCGSGDKYKTCHLEADRSYFARLAEAADRACRGST